PPQLPQRRSPCWCPPRRPPGCAAAPGLVGGATTPPAACPRRLPLAAGPYGGPRNSAIGSMPAAPTARPGRRCRPPRRRAEGAFSPGPAAVPDWPCSGDCTTTTTPGVTTMARTTEHREDLTLKRAAQLIDVSATYLGTLARRGKIPFAVGDDGVRRFKAADL